MPVLILGEIEEIDIVRPLAARLLEDGGELRCYLDDDDYELRNMGCKVAVGSLVDEMNLEGALTNVHTFIPLLPDPVRLTDRSDLDSLVDLGQSAARAVASAGIAQTILAVPAVAGFANPLGEAFALLEREFRKAVKPLCIFRLGFLWGPERPLSAVLRGLGPGQSGSARVGVVRIEDFVALMAAADEREGLEGTWEFGGTEYSLDELEVLAGEGGVAEPGPWFRQTLMEGLVLASSAASHFGIAPSRIP